MGQGGTTNWRSAGGQRGSFIAAPGDGGFALIEMIIGIAVLMIVFIPAAYLLTDANSVVGSDTAGTTAQAVAVSWLNQVRSSSASPESPLPPAGVTSAASPPTWSTSVAGSQQVGSITYEVYLEGGWCAPYTSTTAGRSSTQWVNQPLPSTPPPAYFVAAGVAWGPKISGSSELGPDGYSHHIVQYAQLATQSGWGPPATTTMTNCPLGLS